MANLYILPVSTFIDGPLGPAPAGLFFGSPAPQEHQVNAGCYSVLGLLINMVAPVTESLRVALSSFRQLYDLLGDCVSGWGNWPVRMLEGHQGHLESDAQEAVSLGGKSVALQVVPDRQG